MNSKMLKIFSDFEDQGYVLTRSGLIRNDSNIVDKLDTTECNDPDFLKLMERLPLLYKKTNKTCTITSYKLKHHYQIFYDQYISNGQFILAMLMNDFVLNLKKFSQLNVVFKMTPIYKIVSKDGKQFLQISISINDFKQLLKCK